MKLLLAIVAGVLVTPIAAIAVLFVVPRPADTTQARVFEADGRALDYCDLPELTGAGPSADDIPVAYTPECGWEGGWPMPVLADCTEPLGPGIADLRGLWLGTKGLVGHVERIEQCGNRTVVTAGGIIHDFRTDGTLANGSRDIEPPSCVNTFVAIDFRDGVMSFHPFGLPFTIVKRWMDGDELVWTYPAIEGEIRMKRICKLPREHARR